MASVCLHGQRQNSVHSPAARQWGPTGTEVSLELLVWGLLLGPLCLSLLFTDLVFESKSNQNKLQDDARMQNLFTELTEMPLTLCKCFLVSLGVH